MLLNSSALNILIIDPKWHEVFFAILNQYGCLKQLDYEAQKLEIANIDIVEYEKERFCYSWSQYHLTFSEYTWERRWYPPWTKKRVANDILQYKLCGAEVTESGNLVSTRGTYIASDGTYKNKDGNENGDKDGKGFLPELTNRFYLENSLGKSWTMEVCWVDWNSLANIPDIEPWLKEVCGRYEGTIKSRKKEMEIFEEYIANMADISIKGKDQ